MEDEVQTLLAKEAIEYVPLEQRDSGFYSRAILSRQGLRPGEWRLHPEVVELIWRKFGRAEVDLFASHENSHCPLWYSLSHPAPLGLDAMLNFQHHYSSLQCHMILQKSIYKLQKS
ncbi:hypothetical protein PO909_001356 [Leuciscus waleckii]